MSSLPSFVEFTINLGDGTKYLREINELLSYENDRGFGDLTRFKVVQAANGNVHLKHLHSQKYLARRKISIYGNYIFCTAPNTVEDESNEGCTLFRPVFKNNNTVSFVHVQSGQAVGRLRLDDFEALAQLGFNDSKSRIYDVWVLESESGAVPLETNFSKIVPPTTSLPAFVSFFIQSSGGILYLGHVLSSNGDVILRYSHSESATSPHTRFAVERAEKGDGLVHLRHCFTNKYLVELGPWIAPAATETEEDETKQGCTLFRPESVNGKVKFIHVASETVVSIQRSGVPYLVLKHYTDSVPCETEFFDLESLIVLPKRIVFKGDNGKYLGADRHEGSPSYPECLRFIYDDIADPKVQFEISFHRYGHTLIKSLYYDRFCQCVQLQSRTFIFPTATNGNDSKTWFTVVQGPDGTFGIHPAITNPNQGGELSFCGRADNDHHFIFRAASMIPSVQLTVEEAVVSRTMWVDYRLDSSRIFDAKPLVAASASVVNHSEYTHQTQLNVSYTKARTANWSAGGSYTFGVKTTVNASVPLIAKGSVETSHQVEIHAEAGGSVSQEETVSNTQIVNLPKRSRATATVMATRGKCDIPFTYRQVDQLYNGKRIETVLHDGVYKNVNSYDFNTIIHIVDIDSTEPDTWNILDAYNAEVQASRAELKGVSKFLQFHINDISVEKLPLWKYEEPIIEDLDTEKASKEETKTEESQNAKSKTEVLAHDHSNAEPQNEESKTEAPAHDH